MFSNTGLFRQYCAISDTDKTVSESVLPTLKEREKFPCVGIKKLELELELENV